MQDSRPRVLIVYNQPVIAPDHPDAAQEADVLDTVVEVEKVLVGQEFEVTRFGYARDPRLLLDQLRDFRPDTVFNLFEGEGDRTATEVFHAALLESARVPFTGSGSAGLTIGRDKVLTKYLLQGASLPTAPFLMLETPTVPRWPYEWPAFVKLACHDASVGIEQGSVVTTPAELAARVKFLFDRYVGPVLVEQYIPGREFHVHVFEELAGEGSQLHVMPPAEVRFRGEPGLWPIYTYQAKWHEGSVEYKNAPLVSGAELDGPIHDRLAQVCAASFRLLGLRDYARVDLRVTPDGHPFVLEVNPNPYLNSILLVEGLKAMNRSFASFIRGLVKNALIRGGA